MGDAGDDVVAVLALQVEGGGRSCDETVFDTDGDDGRRSQIDGGDGAVVDGQGGGLPFVGDVSALREHGGIWNVDEACGAQQRCLAGVGLDWHAKADVNDFSRDVERALQKRDAAGGADAAATAAEVPAIVVTRRFSNERLIGFGDLLAHDNERDERDERDGTTGSTKLFDLPIVPAL